MKLFFLPKKLVKVVEFKYLFQKKYVSTILEVRGQNTVLMHSGVGRGPAM